MIRVKLLIVLAATDNDSHINAIVKLAELFDNQDRYRHFVASKKWQKYWLLLITINSILNNQGEYDENYRCMWKWFRQ